MPLLPAQQTYPLGPDSLPTTIYLPANLLNLPCPYPCASADWMLACFPLWFPHLLFPGFGCLCLLCFISISMTTEISPTILFLHSTNKTVKGGGEAGDMPSGSGEGATYKLPMPPHCLPPAGSGWIDRLFDLPTTYHSACWNAMHAGSPLLPSSSSSCSCCWAVCF